MAQYWIRVFDHYDLAGYIIECDTIDELNDEIAKVDQDMYDGKIQDFEVCDY